MVNYVKNLLNNLLNSAKRMRLIFYKLFFNISTWDSFKNVNKWQLSHEVG